MGKKLKRFALALCVLALYISTMSVAVFAAAPVTATIPVEIKLSGTEPAEAETFAVEMTAEDPAYPMPADAVDGVYTMAMEGASSGTIEIEYKKVGIYGYTVKQVPGTNSDCYYDANIYNVTVSVTNNETMDGFVVTVAVHRNEEVEKTQIVFENRYANPDEVTFTAVKTMDGKTPKDGAFTFELLDSEGKLIETVKNVGQSVTFTTLSYYKAGTYEYQIKEVKGDTAGVIYDTSVYDVTVDVTKDEEGNYTAKLTYEKNGKALEAAPVFANKTQTTSPDTGEGTMIYVMGGLMVLSLAGIIALVLLKKRSDRAA